MAKPKPGEKLLIIPYAPKRGVWPFNSWMDQNTGKVHFFVEQVFDKDGTPKWREEFNVNELKPIARDAQSASPVHPEGAPTWEIAFQVNEIEPIEIDMDKEAYKADQLKRCKHNEHYVGKTPREGEKIWFSTYNPREVEEKEGEMNDARERAFNHVNTIPDSSLGIVACMCHIPGWATLSDTRLRKAMQDFAFENPINSSGNTSQGIGFSKMGYLDRVVHNKNFVEDALFDYALYKGAIRKDKNKGYVYGEGNDVFRLGGNDEVAQIFLSENPDIRKEICRVIGFKEKEMQDMLNGTVVRGKGKAVPVPA